MLKNVSLPMDILDTLEEFLHAGMETTQLYEITPGFKLGFRTLTGEEEIECRSAAGEFRGPAYIYTYKAKVLSNVIYELNGTQLPPGVTIKLPKKRTNEAGFTEEVLTDVPIASHLEGIIMTWSKGLIDICFKLWSKHQEDQLYKYVKPLADNDLFTLEERLLAKEYERLLHENSTTTSQMTPDEMIIAVQNATPATDLVKIGAQVTKHAEPHLDFNEVPEER